MSIIQSKAIGYWDFRSGTIDDLIGSNDGTFVSTPYFNREGLVLNGVDESVDLGATGLTLKTVSLLLKPNSTTEDIADLDGGTHTIEVGAGTVTATGFSSPTIYVNGLASTTLVAGEYQSITITTATGISASAFKLGQETTFLGGTIVACVGSEDELTATEVAQLSSELKDTVFPTKPSSKSINKQKANINESGLVGAWDMKPVNGKIQDLSSNNNTGTINGNPTTLNSQLGYALKLNGVDADVEVSDASLNFQGKKALTLSAWVKTNVTTGTHNVLVNGLNQYAYTLSIAVNGRARIVIDNAFETSKDLYGTSLTLRDKQWHHLAATLGTDGTTSTLCLYVDGVLENSSTFSDHTITTSNNGMYIGRAQSTYTNSTIANTEIYDEAKSAAWVLSKYKSGASAVQYKGDYGVNVSDANVTSGQLENTGWTVDSGNWLIDTDMIDGVKVKTFSCITDNGIIYRTAESMGMTTTENAYGTWEFYLYQQDANNEIKIRLADVQDDTSATGYILKYGEDERWGMQAETAGSLADIMYTATGYFTTGTWYKMKVTRSSNGVWTCYRDGVLVDVTGGGSTNPVTHNTFTTAKYLSIQARATDLIAFADVGGDHSFVKKLGVI